MQENLALFEGMWYAGGEGSRYNTVAKDKGHGLGRKVERGYGLHGTRQTTSEWDIYTGVDQAELYTGQVRPVSHGITQHRRMEVGKN